MSESLKSAVRAAILRLLNPLVRVLMQAGIGIGEFTSLVRKGSRLLMRRS